MEDIISIVVPVYNAEKFLRRTIENILQQTYEQWELLLVDDASTDGSAAIMKEYESEKIRCFYCEKNHGPAYARNVGLEHAKGRYLAYQDADDLWEADKLKKQIAFLKQHGYAFTCTSYEFADEHGVTNGRVMHVPAKATYHDFLKSSTLAINTLMFDRTKVADDLLHMPEDVQVEDAATWMQVLRTGIVAYGLDEVLVIYCRHADTRSGNKIKAIWGKWELYHDVEGFSIIKSFYYMVVNTWAAVKRRI